MPAAFALFANASPYARLYWLLLVLVQTLILAKFCPWLARIVSRGLVTPPSLYVLPDASRLAREEKSEQCHVRACAPRESTEATRKDARAMNLIPVLVFSVFLVQRSRSSNKSST